MSLNIDLIKYVSSYPEDAVFGLTFNHDWVKVISSGDAYHSRDSVIEFIVLHQDDAVDAFCMNYK